MKTAYTPGPWTANYGTVIDSNCRRIAAVVGSFNLPEPKANTQLMAAAPEMADLLNRISNWLVCAPIATPEDMAQSFAPFQQEIDALLVKAGCQ